MSAKRKSKKRIFGNERLLMMLCRDIRRRWMQYGENRRLPNGPCQVCGKREGTEIDHKEAVGARPRAILDVPGYIFRMIITPCQRLCHGCHSRKTKRERKARAKLERKARTKLERKARADRGL